MLCCTIHVLTGPPKDISNISIPNNTVTACRFTVQWDEVFSDPVCGTVRYTVAISTGEKTSKYNTTLTNYTATNLNDDVLYNVTVIASNNASSSRRSNTDSRDSTPTMIKTESK